MRNVITVLWLLVMAACADRRGYTPLVLAVIENDVPQVKELLRTGADPNQCVGIPGYTTSPLVAASGLDHAEIVEALLEAGAEPDRECFFVPLDLAANNGSLRAMRLLIRGGADVHRKSAGGATYLMSTAIGAHPETVPILVAAGCPVDERAPKRRNETALMVAAGWDTGMTRALLDAGASVHLRDDEGATPLLHAMRGAIHSRDNETSPGKWDASILEMLLDAGADPAVRDSGRSLTQLAVQTGRHRASIEAVLRKRGLWNDAELSQNSRRQGSRLPPPSARS